MVESGSYISASQTRGGTDFDRQGDELILMFGGCLSNNITKTEFQKVVFYLGGAKKK